MKQKKQDVTDFIEKSYSICRRAKELCVSILNDELGGSVTFDWKEGNAPSISSCSFDEDITDAYISHIFMENGLLKADLHAYYIGEDRDGIELADECNVDYLDILEYLNNLRED